MAGSVICTFVTKKDGISKLLIRKILVCTQYMCCFDICQVVLDISTLRF